MYDNFENLQKKCKKYKFKKKIKLSLQIALIPAILLIVILINSVTKQDYTPTEPQKTLVTQEKKVEKTAIKKEKKKRVIKDVPYILLIDSKFTSTKVTQTQRYKKHTSPRNTPKVYIKKESKKPVEIAVKKLDSINDMIHYYNKENKYSLAIKIAQSYYDSKQYSKSLLWAKKANLLDRDDDKAWILYAKSEYAQNNKKRAIKILKLYLTNSLSKDAEGLLLMWNQGK